MPDIKIGGPATAQGPQRTKTTKRPTEGGSFASMLDETPAAAPVAPSSPATFAAAYLPIEDGDGQPAPREAKQQARDLMDNLQTLAEDVLAGQPSKAVNRLEAYLQAEVTDAESLSA